MKTAEIKELSVKELIERIETEKANLQKAKINHAISPVENSTTINKARKNIARMLTVLKQNETK